MNRFFPPHIPRRYYAEWQGLFHLAGPILAAQLAQQALAFLDTLMAGRVSPVDLAGVAVGGSMWGPLFLFLYGLFLAATPISAQLHGAGRTNEVGPLVRRGMLLALPATLGAVLFLLAAPMIFPRMGVEPEVSQVATRYLQGIACGVPAVPFFFLLRNLSEGIGLTRPSMLIGLLSIPINALANATLIYGFFGFPALGGAGCGWATALTLWCMLGMLFWIMRRRPVYAATGLFDLQRRCADAGARQILKIGLPIGSSFLVESSIFALIALFLAPLGALAVASHQITLNYSSLIFMIPLSIASALSIRVGHAVGRGRPDQARLASKAGILVNTAISTVTALVTLFCAPLIARMYTPDTTLIPLVVGLLALNALYQVPDAIQVGAAAALRGYKDTRVPLLLMLVAYWVIALPVGYGLGVAGWWGTPMGARGFWISLLVGLSLAAIFLCWRLFRLERRRSQPQA